MKVIIETGQLLLIIPSYLQRDTHPWQAYLIFFAAVSVLLALNVLCLWTRLDLGSDLLSFSVILDTLSTLSTFNVVVWFWYSGFKRKRLFLTFLKTFDDYKFGKFLKQSRIYAKIGNVLMYTTIFYALDCYSWLQIEPFQGYSTYILEKIEYIHTYCCLLLYCEIIEFIELRFSKIASDLNKVIRDRKKKDRNSLRSVKLKIRSSIQDYIIATKQVDSFNKLFGTGIFFYYIDMLMGFVLGVNNGFILLNERTVDKEDVAVKKIIVALCFAFAVMELLAGIKLAMTCRDVMTKLVEAGDAVFETLQEFSVMDDCAIALGIRHELVIFCKHTMDVQPFFSAGGFFKIDSTLLTDIINSVITYIVMLAQLNKTLST
ncbi:hypothetical protein Trydic_g6421 [Trypoxylus dichotomus]